MFRKSILHVFEKCTNGHFEKHNIIKICVLCFDINFYIVMFSNNKQILLSFKIIYFFLSFMVYCKMFNVYYPHLFYNEQWFFKLTYNIKKKYK